MRGGGTAANFPGAGYWWLNFSLGGGGGGGQWVVTPIGAILTPATGNTIQL